MLSFNASWNYLQSDKLRREQVTTKNKRKIAEIGKYKHIFVKRINKKKSKNRSRLNNQLFINVFNNIYFASLFNANLSFT